MFTDLRNLLVNNEWKRFFTRLTKLDYEAGGKFINEIALLNARYKATQKDRMRGIASSQDINIEMNRIRQAALHVLTDFETSYKEQMVEENSVWSPSKRLALIVGCSTYEYATKLRNPNNDAQGMKAALEALHFDVEVLLDPTLKELKMAIDNFGERLKGADTGLFFFAGHGVQVSGINYLIPKDANLQSEQMVEYDCINVGRVLAHMEAAATNVNILILDACRNNPFERSWTRSINTRGLAAMDAPKGSLIAYATAPGTVASDGEGENGLYTEALLNNIKTPNATLNQLFQEVRKAVMKKSNDTQVPWEATSLTADFYFLKQ